MQPDASDIVAAYQVFWRMIWSRTRWCHVWCARRIPSVPAPPDNLCYPRLCTDVELLAPLLRGRVYFVVPSNSIVLSQKALLSRMV